MSARQGSAENPGEDAISAGVAELLSYDCERDRAADTVRRIYLAVLEQCQCEQRTVQALRRHP